MQQVKEYKLDFSNRVIEHLGIKLYQNKPTNVIAEFVSNAWDADAKNVCINLIAGTGGKSQGISITDNGIGMSRNELIDEFLVIGRNRRKSPEEKTTNRRTPMGRKGIGKLAGFGIARTVDLLSVPNPKIRTDSAEPKLYWLRFELDEILSESGLVDGTGYSPKIISDGIALSEINALIEEQSSTYNGIASVLKDFLGNIESGAGGVCVYLHNTTLKRSINPDNLLSSLGSRFTVTMLHPDFNVKVNGNDVTPENALPVFQEYCIGSIKNPIIEKIIIGKIEREVKYWVGFVSLKDTEWPIENAGVGVYAHGKIAQDRPFFFGSKGKEILSRYMYGVVEADWLDELPDDVVSTDRRSINWDDNATEVLHQWGAKKLSEWIEGYRQWKKEKSKDDLKKIIRERPISKGLSPAEEDALADLLGDVLLTLGNNEEAKITAIDSITSAWTHEPTRKLTKSLWKEIINDDGKNPTTFVMLMDRLKDSMVPEAMGLAVTMAQRIAAISALIHLVSHGKIETQLQRLIEKFPWLLGPEWEKLCANQEIKTLIEKKYTPQEISIQPVATGYGINLKPDFVFLSDVGQENEIIVFELKGAECGKTLQPEEYKQLREYLDVIEGAYPNTPITGKLIGHEKGGFKENDKRIEVLCWDEVLKSARKLHTSYLASLLHASDPSHQDWRLGQVKEFGGPETVELLKRLGVIVDYEPSVAAIIGIK